MRRPSKHKHSQLFTPHALFLATVLYLAISPLALCNTLRADDRAAESINTVARMDSLFKTVFDPEVSPGKGKGWKPYNRMAWLYGQRAFPSGSIPAGARMQAWEAKQAARSRSSLDENWTAIGPNNIAGRILCIKWHPTNTNLIYVGSASGGLWKTTNGGTNWTPLTDNLPSLAIGAIALDPANPDIVYIGTGEGSFNIDAVYGGGIFKSTDGGSTWNVLSGMSWQQSESRAVNSIIIHPSNSQILWAATNIAGSGGVFKTTNGGTSWTRYLSGDAKDLEIDPSNANTLYAGLGYPWGSSSNGVYKSTDGGLTWTLSSTGLPSASNMGRMELALSPSNPQVLYAGLSQTLSAGAGLLGFYKSTNGGSSWTLQASSPNFYSGQGWYNLVCEVHPTDPNTVFSSGLDCYKSTNSGANWTQKTYWNYSVGHSLYAHADHHALAFMPGNPNTVLVGTDGGIFKSTNGGDTWTGLNNGLVTFQFYAMGHDVLNSSVCYGGTQDNGTNKYTGSTTWSAVLGGDGGYCNVDYTNSNIVYAETQRGSHYKSTNSGSSWSSIQSGISGYGSWVTPVEMDPANPSILYTGTTAVYRTTNGGSSWTAISGNLNGQYISSIAVAPSNTSVIYAGTENNGQVWRTTNGGTNWSSVSTGLPYKYITRVAVHPTDANTVFATVSGYGSGHVWKTTNGGGSWTNSSTGLLDIPCNVIVINQANPNYMYVGTDLGVYASTNGGTSWSDYSTGMPNVVVDDLKLHPTTGMLRAATHGRGMWETATGVPTITVLSPNGGETWTVGSSQTITWSAGGVGGNVSITINRSYPGGSWETILASTPNDGNQAWTVTTPVTSTARVRVTSLSEPSATDESNGNFTVSQPQLTILNPNGGETLVAGRTDTIRWSLTGATGTVAVEFQRNYPSSTWTYLGQTTGSSYNWAVTAPAASTVRVRAYWQSNPTVMDTSNANFTIVEPSVTLTTPNGGEQLTPGSTYIIRWTQQYATGTKKVEINRTYPAGSWETLSAAVSADSLVWIVDQNATAAARIRVTINSYPSALDISDANFTIRTPTLAVTAPNGGEQWTAGTVSVVRWTRANLDGPVNLHVNRSYPSGSWDLIAVNVTADTFAWTVNTPYSNAARVRVSAVNIPSYTDESNANFFIGTALVVTAPNGGESWAVGSQQTLAWTRYNASGNATVQINRTYPSGTWVTLTSTASGDNYVWTVTAPGSSTARIRVFLTATPTLGDTSNADFAIPNPALVVTAPNGGDVWATGSAQTISWSRNNADGNVTVQLNRSYPGSTWETLTTTAGGTTLGWTVSGSATVAARVRIFLSAAPTTGDTSDANFSIGTPALTMLSPVGGETWLQGSTQTIRWSRAYAAGNAAVQINRNYPSGGWETLAAAVAADSLQWTVTGAATSAARMRVYLVSSPSVVGMSSANFALAVPALTVTAPNGGEGWLIGAAQTIQFTRSNADGAVTVQLNRTYPGGTWETISNSTTTSSVAWTPQGTPSATCRIRAYLNAIPACGDTSNANFSLVSSSLTVLAPNGGEALTVGQSTVITWSRFSATGAVSVALNRTYPSGAWETLHAADSDDSLSWTVTGPAATTARVRVTLNSNPAIADESNANVSIIQPALTLTAPAAGSQVTLGGPLTVRWTRTAAPGAVTVLLNRNYPGGVWEQLTTTAAADSFVWTSTGAASTTCRIKIQLTNDASVSTISTGDFTLISRSVQLASHNGGDTYYTGTSSSVTIARTNATGNVTVQLNRNYPAGSWEVLSTTVSGSSYAWGVAGTLTSAARLRIFLNSESFIGDTSDTAFSIANPALVLTVPNGGEVLEIGTTQTISWERRGVTDNVRVEIKRSYPSGSWTILAASVAGSSYNWPVTGPASDLARIRVISTVNSALADTSAAAFAIAASALALQAPNGGETASIGIPYTVRWSQALAAGEARVELNRNYPSGTWEVLGNTTADTLLWNVSGATSSAARVRVYLLGAPTVGDTSAANFTILQPALDLTAPVGGELWRLGTEQTIAWSRSGISGAVRVELKSNYPEGSWTILNSGNTGNSFVWTVAGGETHNARIRIVSEEQPLYADTSGTFALANPALIVLAPAGGDTLVVGQPYVMRWSRLGLPGLVRVELNRSYPGGTWEQLTGSTTADTLLWTPTEPVSQQARVRVTLLADPSKTDISDEHFNILRQAILLTSPAAGDSVTLGMPVTFRWTRVGIPAGVNVYVKRLWPSGSWELLGSNIAADQWSWTASGSAASGARFRVSSVSLPTIGDTTDTAVPIGSPLFMFYNPASAATYLVGEQIVLRWGRQFAPGDVRVEVSRGGTGGPWTEIGVTSGDSIAWTVASPASNTVRFRCSLVNASWAAGMTSFNCTIVVPALTVTAPGTGHVQALGRNLTLQWSRTSVTAPVNVYLQRSSELPLETLRLNVTGDSIHWTASGGAADSARIVIRTAEGVLVEAQSAAFVLRQPALQLTSPLGGETLIAGQTLTTQWTRVANSDAVSVQLNRDYPAGAWTTLGQQLSGSQLLWTVTAPTTTTARVRVISETDAALGDTTGSNLSLLVPELALDALGRSRVPVGFPVTISWSRTAVDGPLTLLLSRDGGATWPTQIATNLNGNSVIWTPAAPASDRARLKLLSAVNPAIFTVSEEFSLALPQFAVSFPAGGETFTLGSTITLHWSAEDHPAGVNVQLARNYPSGSWETLAANVTADSLAWTSGGAEALSARVRIVSVVDSAWRGESGTFALRAAALTITAPTAGGNLIVGDSLAVAWQRIAYDGSVRVLLRRAGSAADTLAASVAGSSVTVLIASPEASSAWLIVEDAAARLPCDSISLAGPFIPQLDLLAPVAGARWVGGRTEVIRWSRWHAAGAVEVRINYNYPSGAWQTVGTTSVDSLVFIPSGAETNTAAVTLRLVARPAIAATVTGVRLVNPALTLQPLAANSYPLGSTLHAAWNAHEVDGSIVLELKRSYPSGSWETLYTGTNTAFPWTVSGATTGAARLRVRSVNYPQAADTLDNSFAIVPAFIDLQLFPAADSVFIGRSVNLLLNLNGAGTPATIELQRTAGGSWEPLFANIAEGTHIWTVTGPETPVARLRAVIDGMAELADSTNPFAIVAPRVAFTNSFFAEYFTGDTLRMAWNTLGSGGPYRLLLRRDAAAAETLLTGAAGTTFNWIVTPPRASIAALILEDQVYGLRDTGDVFAIRDPQLAFTWPSVSGTDTAGTAVNIAWAWTGGSGAVRLEVSQTSATGPWTTLADSVAATQFAYVVTGPDTDSLRFRVSALARPAVRTVSVPRRVIEPRLELGVPGEETWYIGQQQWIRWSSAHYNGEVRLELTPGDRAAEWIELAQLAADSFLWTVEGPEAELVALRLTAVSVPGLTDTTDTPLRIAQPFLQVVAPNGGDALETGQEIRLRWIGAGFDGNVAIALWRGAPVNRLDTLFAATANDSSEIWTVTGPAATECMLLVVARNNPAIFDTSDARFSITGESAAENARGLPRAYALGNPYPNPFNSTTQIEFALPRDGAVRLVVYDVLGREAAVLLDENRRAGIYRIAWHAADAATGTYFLRMTTGEFHAVRKLHFVK